MTQIVRAGGFDMHPQKLQLTRHAIERWQERGGDPAAIDAEIISATFIGRMDDAFGFLTKSRMVLIADEFGRIATVFTVRMWNRSMFRQLSRRPG